MQINDKQNKIILKIKSIENKIYTLFASFKSW